MASFHKSRDSEEGGAAKLTVSSNCTGAAATRNSDELFIVPDQAAVSFTGAVSVALGAGWYQVLWGVIASIPVEVIR